MSKPWYEDVDQEWGEGIGEEDDFNEGDSNETEEDD